MKRTLLILLSLLIYATPVAAVHNANAKWVDQPENGAQNNIHYQLRNNWPGGNAGLQAKSVSVGRDEWNEQIRELNYCWCGWGTIRVDVTYEDLMWPNQNALGVAVYETYWLGNLNTGNVILNSWPDWWAQANTKWFWADDEVDLAPPGKYDARSLAAHEFGHLVVLSRDFHTDRPDVMHCCFADGEERFQLSAHDKAGIVALYPPR